jgi:hypothetical protein
LAAALARLFSGAGFARTHRAHCAPLGSADPGGLVANRAGAAASAPRGARAEAVGRGDAVPIASTDSGARAAEPVAAGVEAAGVEAAGEGERDPSLATTTPAVVTTARAAIATAGHARRRGERFGPTEGTLGRRAVAGQRRFRTNG